LGEVIAGTLDGCGGGNDGILCLPADGCEEEGGVGLEAKGSNDAAGSRVNGDSAADCWIGVAGASRLGDGFEVVDRVDNVDSRFEFVSVGDRTLDLRAGFDAASRPAAPLPPAPPATALPGRAGLFLAASPRTLGDTVSSTVGPEDAMAGDADTAVFEEIALVMELRRWEAKLIVVELDAGTERVRGADWGGGGADDVRGAATATTAATSGRRQERRRERQRINRLKARPAAILVEKIRDRSEVKKMQLQARRRGGEGGGWRGERR
jgi:hypothetical protein